MSCVYMKKIIYENYRNGYEEIKLINNNFFIKNNVKFTKMNLEK